MTEETPAGLAGRMKWLRSRVHGPAHRVGLKKGGRVCYWLSNGVWLPRRRH